MEFKKEFEIRLDDGEITFPMKVEAWAKKQNNAIRFIVETFILPWLKEVWVAYKTEVTMNDVDHQAKALVTSWEEEERDMQKPITTVVEDPEAPLGIKEMRIRAPWVDK